MCYLQTRVSLLKSPVVSLLRSLTDTPNALLSHTSISKIQTSWSFPTSVLSNNYIRSHTHTQTHTSSFAWISEYLQTRKGIGLAGAATCSCTWCRSDIVRARWCSTHCWHLRWHWTRAHHRRSGHTSHHLPSTAKLWLLLHWHCVSK